jgi:hypothetical protein
MTSDRLQGWLDKLALTELLAVLSAAVDRGDRETIIDCSASRTPGPVIALQTSRSGAAAANSGSVA